MKIEFKSIGEIKTNGKTDTYDLILDMLSEITTAGEEIGKYLLSNQNLIPAFAKYVVIPRWREKNYSWSVAVLYFDKELRKYIQIWMFEDNIRNDNTMFPLIGN